MIAASLPIQRPARARLLVVEAGGRIVQAPRVRLVDFLRPGDVVVANDAATLPASLTGVHVASGAAVEVRLAGCSSLLSGVTSTTGIPAGTAIEDHPFSAVVFGSGDFRMRTEDRPPPPSLTPGDRFAFGELSATIEAVLDHPRFVSLRFDGSIAAFWRGLTRHGRPIQYAHIEAPLALWDVWTPIAALPAAFEPPSAGFAIGWRMIQAMGERGIAFATITLAAGISSTGDAALDRRLPLDEPYRIPEATARSIGNRPAGGRVVAVGTTVVRALEHAAARHGAIVAGGGVADQRIGPDSVLRLVDAIVSGTHEPDSSHFQLLRAFAGDETLAAMSHSLETCGFRTHEFGDSVLIERANVARGSAGDAEVNAGCVAAAA